MCMGVDVSVCVSERVMLCCGVLLCDTVCCSVLQCTAECFRVLQSAVVCCSVLRVLQCVSVC